MIAHWKKIERTLQFLTGEESNYISDNDIVVFSDSTDVFFINNIEEIRNVYENYYVKELAKIDLEADGEKDWPLVFIAEKNKWPPNEYIQNMFEVSAMHSNHILTFLNNYSFRKHKRKRKW